MTRHSTHGSPELDADAAKLIALGADPGPTTDMLPADAAATIDGLFELVQFQASLLQEAGEIMDEIGMGRWWHARTDAVAQGAQAPVKPPSVLTLIDKDDADPF
jgi:hypothetical protein